MGNYGVKERMIARVLSKLPGVKRIVKNTYVLFNAAIYRKSYKYRKYGGTRFSDPKSSCFLKEGEESFFGYYDKCPMNNSGWVINHVTSSRTICPAKKGTIIKIVLYNIYSQERLDVGETTAFSWQQGSRTQWVGEHEILFNFFDEQSNSWKSKLYSLETRKIENVYDEPVQDAYGSHYILSLDYKRLNTLTVDYGYQDCGVYTHQELKDLNAVAISMIDCRNGDRKVLAFFKDIIAVDYKDEFKNAIHSVNHIMINKQGTSFIFIHRYYVNGIRKDRLMLCDFESFKVLSDFEMVSHCCWVNENTVYGYLRYKGKDGYYYIDVNSLDFKLNEKVLNLGLGDGHPSVYGDLIVFDTYPDRSRMQGLYLCNRKKNKVEQLLEVFQGTGFKESSRCDLHPRFANDGNIIFFDSVYEGKRRQYFININQG